MTTEEKLKEYILTRYNSIREFAQIAEVSNSTLDSILKRGVNNSNLTNIKKICKTLGISVDELAEGRITPIVPTKVDYHLVNENIDIEVSDFLRDTKSHLELYKRFTLNGKPIDKESLSTIIKAIEIGEDIAKKK